MRLSAEQIKEHIAAIDQLGNPASNKYGKLLRWQNPWDPFRHYGIGLSDTHIFDTGQRLCPFERTDATVVTGIEHLAFPPTQTIKRLKHALWVFANWDYNFLGWNCEHLSRLIATDQPRCYQSSPIWWLGNMTAEGDHKTALQIFHHHLRATEPDLLR